MDEVTNRAIPDELRTFATRLCGLAAGAFTELPPERLSATARRLLVHQQDMTSTLAAFHATTLDVEILRQRQVDQLYLREVFLRGSEGQIVEYGVIAIALDQFTPGQREAILSGEAPLGALLHRFQIPFTSAPISFFSVSADALARTPLGALSPPACYGRFNRLARASGEPLAWIMEILPPSPPSPS